MKANVKKVRLRNKVSMKENTKKERNYLKKKKEWRKYKERTTWNINERECKVRNTTWNRERMK